MGAILQIFDLVVLSFFATLLIVKWVITRRRLSYYRSLLNSIERNNQQLVRNNQQLHDLLPSADKKEVL